MDSPRFDFLDHEGPIAFAHRGGALEGPENTWESFGHAHDLGYRYMETDVHATRDGIVVAFHDEDLERTASRPGLVREMTWAELSQVELNGGGRVPRVDELMAAWPDVRWNVDVKHDFAVGPVIETVHRASARNRVCVTSFSDRRLARLRKALGEGTCSAVGPIGVTVLRIASLIPWLVPRALERRLQEYGAVQVPIRQGRIPLVDGRFIDTAHRLGLQVHVWTVDDEATMDRLLGLGVDGIMTDRPTALREVLARRGSPF
jgi:glycerophosphoryl diester phosphodiesterase